MICYLWAFINATSKGPLRGMRKRDRREKPAYVSWWKLILKGSFVHCLMLRHWEWKVWKSIRIFSWQLWNQSWWESELRGVWWWFKVLSALEEKSSEAITSDAMSRWTQVSVTVKAERNYLWQRSAKLDVWQEMQFDGMAATCPSRERKLNLPGLKTKSEKRGDLKRKITQRWEHWSTESRLLSRECIRSEKEIWFEAKQNLPKTKTKIFPSWKPKGFFFPD